MQPVESAIGQDDFGALRDELRALRAELHDLRAATDAIGSTVSQIDSVVGPFGVPLPDNTMLVQTLYGVKFVIDPLDTVMAPNLIVYRQWESDLSGFFWNSLTPDDVFVDVGANFGYFTCLCAEKIGRSGRGRVFSFEPNPACLRLLDKNLVINWSMSPVQVFRGAAGVQRTVVKLSVPRGHAANASLSIPARDADLIDVQMIRIDAFVPEDVVATFMKVDVEGHEYGALKGAAALIARSPNIKIVMEWSPEQIREAGYRIDQMLDLFEELKLTCHRLPPTIHDFDPAQSLLSRADMGSIGYDNILLCRA